MDNVYGFSSLDKLIFSGAARLKMTIINQIKSHKLLQFSYSFRCFFIILAPCSVSNLQNIGHESVNSPHYHYRIFCPAFVYFLRYQQECHQPDFLSRQPPISMVHRCFRYDQRYPFGCNLYICARLCDEQPVLIHADCSGLSPGVFCYCQYPDAHVLQAKSYFNIYLPGKTFREKLVQGRGLLFHAFPNHWSGFQAFHHCQCTANYTFQSMEHTL